MDTANTIGCLFTTDQRGVWRPIDGNHDGNHDGINGCDIGAIELQLLAYIPLIEK